MTHRRTKAAILAVLAVTTATLATPVNPAVAVPAVAERAVSATTTEQQGAIALPPGARVVGNGPSGFLTRQDVVGGLVHQWTRYADGVATTLPAGAYMGTVQTDHVVKSEGTTHKLYDMATSADPIVIDTAALGASAVLRRLAGSTLVMAVPRTGGGTDVHLVTKPEGTLLDRKVPGLPADAAFHSYDLSSPDTLILGYTGTVGGVSGTRIALVDVATATVVEDRALPAAGNASDVSTSDTHVSWVENATSGAASLVVARRGQPETTRVPLGSGAPLRAELMGDWVTYAVTGGTTALEPNPLHALTARSLTTGRTVKLLDSVVYIRSEAGGTQLVRGGTIEQGEGLYRIAPGADGTPVATLVGSTGQPTALGVLRQNVPAVTDLSTTAGDVSLWWEFDRGSAEVRVQLTHTASGKRWTPHASYLDDRPGITGSTWRGLLDDRTAAYNGEYTWRMMARPRNGIGPTVERTGTLTVASKPARHDFSDSGSPDLLVRSGSRLLGYDGRQILHESGDGPREQVDFGSGWDTYDRLVAPGNLDHSPYADMIGRDRNGALWFYSGTGHAFAPRMKIGSGWQIYHQITGGSDLTGDGRPDLVATDKAGDLWLYKSTGSLSAPFAPRRKIGYGWGVYNKLIATGDIGGSAAGDLLARDKDAVLWLYLGKGDGTFAPRVRIGGGWDRYSDIVSIGDTNRDGRPDLVVHGIAGGSRESLALYLGTGDWRSPFTGRIGVYTPKPLATGPMTLF